MTTPIRNPKSAITFPGRQKDDEDQLNDRYEIIIESPVLRFLCSFWVFGSKFPPSSLQTWLCQKTVKIYLDKISIRKKVLYICRTFFHF